MAILAGFAGPRQTPGIQCNQAAGFSLCLTNIQTDLFEQLRILQEECQDGSSSLVNAAVKELQFLLNFNQAVTSNLAMSMGALTDMAVTDLANVTLMRLDAYLEHVKRGIKVDTLRDLRTAPVQSDTLFPDPLVRRAEEEIIAFNSTRQSPATAPSGRAGRPQATRFVSQTPPGAQVSQATVDRPRLQRRTSGPRGQNSNRQNQGRPNFGQKQAKGPQQRK